MSTHTVVSLAEVRKIWTETYERLTELASATGCESGAARAFQDGRFAALKELGLLGEDNAPRRRFISDDDDEIRQRRLDLDDALRTRGTRPGRDPLLVEPIVRSSSHD